MSNRHRAGLVAGVLRWLALPALLAAAVGGAPLSVAHAVGSIIVVDTLDGGAAADDGFCSLREAIDNANDEAATHNDCTAGIADDEISFGYAASSGTITLTSALPEITDTDGLAIYGGETIVIDGGNSVEIFTVNTGAALTLDGLVIQNASDACCSGGAIYVHPGATVTIRLSLLYNNHATGNGGAIYNNGTLTVERSTFTSNSAEVSGGGVYNNAGTAEISDSTFYANEAATGQGGGVMSVSGLTLKSSTFSGNASAAGGAAVQVGAGAAGLYNNILANSTSGFDCSIDGGSVSGGYDLIESDDCGFTDGVDGMVLGEDPHLGSLVGVPAFFLLKADSPAIDAGDVAQQYGPTDQPGNTRTVDNPWAPDTGDDNGSGAIIDMGAYEYQITCPGGQWYVDQSATGAQLGNSWTDAFTDLQMALHSIVVCGTPVEVWVANGLYKPDGADPGNRELSFNIPPGAALYGGFAGGETDISEQDWQANVTVLSGDIDDDDTVDGNQIVVNHSNIHNNNSYHVVTMDGTAGTPVTSSTVLDGFTITAGKASGASNDATGGGLLCNGSGTGSDCSPLLEDLHFSGNYASSSGGGLINNAYPDGASSPTLQGVTFTRNHAGNGGGGMANYAAFGGESSPTLNDVVFDHNSAGGGGGMSNGAYQGTSSPTLTDVLFDGNTASSMGGAMWSDGASGSSSPILTRVTFTGNSAQYGGAMRGEAGSGNYHPTLTDVIFEANTALQDGGAMYNNAASGSSNPVLWNVTFTGNSADGSGGAMYNNGSSNGESSPDIYNSTFQGNGTAIIGDGTEDGGAIYNNADGGVSGPTLIHVTISGNEANISGGGIVNSAQSSGSSNGWVVNSIVYGNTAPVGAQIQNALGTPTSTSSAIQDSFPGGVWDLSLGTDGGGNTAGDPMLDALADNGGFTETMALLAGSSAVDTADDDECLTVTDDQRGLTRPQGPHCDMGAFEVGTVTISGNAGVAGAELSYDDGGPQTATADGSGNYNFEVPANWTGTVTPALPHYFFFPASLDYANLFDDQTNQDYTAVPYVKFAPANGATVCRQPTILVKLKLSDLTRTGTGSFDAATVTFEVDNVSVLAQASQRVPQTAPNDWVHMTYKPTSDLSLGAHSVEFTHPETTGTITDAWSLTAANIACTDPVLLSAPADTGTEQSSGGTRQLLSSAAAAPETGSALSASQAETEMQAETSAASAPAVNSASASPQARSSVREMAGDQARGVPHPGIYQVLMRGVR